MCRNGTILTVASSCQATAPQVQINYTSNSVIATVVSGSTPTTTTLATPNPSSASTNQKVTLTATVTTNTNGNVAPSGTVAFSANGAPIPGLHEPAGQRQRIDWDGDVHDVICRRQLAEVADGGVHRLKRFWTDRLDQHPAVADRQQGSDRHQARGVQSESGCGRRRDVHGHGDPERDRREHALGHGRVHGQRQPDLELPSSAADDRVVDGDVRGLLLGRRGAFDHRRLWRRRQLLGLDLTGHHGDGQRAVGQEIDRPSAGPRRPTDGDRADDPIHGEVPEHAAVPRALLVDCHGAGKNKKLTTVGCASGSFRIRANRSLGLRVTLSRACLRLLRAQANHRLTVIYTTKSQTGQVGQRNRITLVLR